MNFAYPYLLLLELLIPALVVFYIFALRRQRKAMESFGQTELLERISSASSRRRKIKMILLVTAVFFLIVALARPQFGMKLVDVKQSGADVIIAVDVSNSMLTEDIKPNRLEKAKTVLSRFVQQLAGNRVGIIAYAGTAFWQCPLTLDISSVNLFLEIMDVNLIPLPGTNVGGALKLAVDGLSKTSPKSKVIVLLTDGEDHKSDALAIAEEAARQGIKIFTIGFGNTTGEPIPVRDAQGNFTGYKKDKKGNVVMSKLDEGLLMKLASATGGEYYRAQDGNIEAAQLVNRINSLEKSALSSKLHERYEDRYQYFLFVGLLLLLIEYVIPETRKTENREKR